jgi:isopentenyl-diphosphate delta-isomerase
VKFDNGLIENEFVYAYLGYCEETPCPNPEEVEDWKWMNINSVKEEMILFPEKYSFWFKYSYDDFLRCFLEKSK